ncbi:hypothetical protein D3C86_1011600 [compost metagenome]
MRGQQPVALRHRPLAAVLVVELAHHTRDLLAAADPTEQLFLQLVFQHLALFLDHQDLVQPFRELLRARGLQRPHHPHLEQAQPDAPARVFGQPQIGQRLARIQIGLARSHDAKAGIALRHLPEFAVQPVGADIGQRRVQLVVQQPGFLLQRRIGQPDVQAIRRQHEILGQQDPHALRVHVDRRRYLDDIGDALHADPHARVAAHRPPVQAVVQHFLDAGRKQRRNHAGLQDVVALVRQGRGLGGVVVPRHHQHAAMARRARGIGVLEDVAAAVHARALAVPHAKDAVVPGARKQIDLLRAPDGRRGQVFIDAGLELDVVRLQVLGRLPHVLVDATQRRPPVARHEARRVQPRFRIAHALHHGQAHQGVDAAHPGAAGFQGVFVVELDGFKRRAHGGRKGGIHGYSKILMPPPASRADPGERARADKGRESEVLARSRFWSFRL